MYADYRKDQNFWHIIFTLIYLSLMALSLYVLYKVNGSVPSKIQSKDIFFISLAIFRLTRLFTYDSVTSFVRDFFSRFQRGPGRTINNLLDCPWCTSVWMAVIVVFFYFLTPYAWYPIFILSMAGVAAFVQITIWKIGLEN